MASRARGLRALPVVVVLVIAGVVTSCSPPTAARWEQLTTSAGPSSRPGARMAFDRATSQLLLFGGLANFQPAADTWTLQNATWHQETPATSPPARYDPVMVYDVAHSNIVLFGGSGGLGALGDTWLWNGSTWTQQHPSVSPGPREAAVAAYSPATGSVILFGGEHDGIYLNDTWSWDGTTWTQLNEPTAPGARGWAVMSYDEAHQNLVLYSGWNGSTTLADTWLFDASGWTNTNATPNPGARMTSSMAYQGDVREVILFGFGSNTDTWAWTGTAWEQRAVSLPPPRDDAAIAYDAGQNRLVLFGGTSGNPLNDTWIYWVPPDTITGVAYHCTGQTTDNIISGGAPQTQTFAFDATFDFERVTFPKTAHGSNPVFFSVGRIYSPDRFRVQTFGSVLSTVDVGTGMLMLADTWNQTGWQSDFAASGGNPASVPISVQPTFEDVPGGLRPVWNVPPTTVNPNGASIEWRLPQQLSWSGTGTYVDQSGGVFVQIVQTWNGTCSRPAPAVVAGTTLYN